MNPLLLGSIIQTVGKVADDLFTSDAERAKAELDAYNAETQRLATQTEINRVEAGSDDWFVRRWRPAVGWVGVVALAYQFVAYPILVWSWHAMQAAGWISIGLTEPPLLDVEALMVLLTGMLGIAGARTWEKVKGVAK